MDLEPFPLVPPGALYTGDGFLIQSAVSLAESVAADELIVVSDVGLAYLRGAIAEGPKLDRSVVYVPEPCNTGSGTYLRSACVTYVKNTRHPIAVIPTNVVTDLNLEAVEHFHKAKGRPYVSVVCVPADAPSEQEWAEPGYRPTETMLIEQGFLKCGKRAKSTTIEQMLADAAERGKVNQFLFDGYYFEVDNEKDYLSVAG